jgi:hypothetical protein
MPHNEPVTFLAYLVGDIPKLGCSYPLGVVVVEAFVHWDVHEFHCFELMELAWDKSVKDLDFQSALVSNQEQEDLVLLRTRDLDDLTEKLLQFPSVAST